jgi:hypothetical protein
MQKFTLKKIWSYSQLTMSYRASSTPNLLPNKLVNTSSIFAIFQVCLCLWGIGGGGHKCGGQEVYVIKGCCC